MSSICKFFRDQIPIDIPLAPPGSSGSAIPAGTAWMPKGHVTFGGVVYDCTNAGRYCFWDKSQNKINTRLVYCEPNQVNYDLYGFLSGLSWHHRHDTADQSLTGQTLAAAGATHVYRLKCGYITDLARWYISTKWGTHTTRSISLTTSDPQWAVANGHTVFEVMDGKWKLWDLTNGLIFRDSNGVHLSAAEIIDLGMANVVKERIDGVLAKRMAAVDAGWDTATFTDLYWYDGPEPWLERIYQNWAVIP